MFKAFGFCPYSVGCYLPHGQHDKNEFDCYNCNNCTNIVDSKISTDDDGRNKF